MVSFEIPIDYGEAAVRAYLDYNANAPIRPQAARAVAQTLDEQFGNPSSAHRWGHRAKVVLERARGQVAALLSARPEEIVFTSSATEANNLALCGAAAAQERPRHMVVSQIEHSSVLEPAADLERRGWKVSRIAPDPEGWVDPARVLEALGEETFLVSLMHANHEVGTLQSVSALAPELRRRGILLHCDAAQSAGKVALSAPDLGADLITLSAGKLGGACGAGCLWVRDGVPLSPLLRGGSQEGRRRAGTQGLALLAGFGAAAQEAGAGLQEEGIRLAGLRDRLEEELRQRFPSVRLHGRGRQRLPGTTNFALPGVRGEDLVLALDLEGVAVSTGSACDAGTIHASHVLQAMGIPPSQSGWAVRVSLGHASRAAEIDFLLAALSRILERLPRAGVVPEAFEVEAVP
jgi:cysteine desulfurase